MTAVEWLEQQLTYQYEGQTLNKFYDWKDLSEIYKQAKELEKIVITKAYEDKMHDLHNGLLRFGEKYYKDNYEN